MRQTRSEMNDSSSLNRRTLLFSPPSLRESFVTVHSRVENANLQVDSADISPTPSRIIETPRHNANIFKLPALARGSPPPLDFSGHPHVPNSTSMPSRRAIHSSTMPTHTAPAAHVVVGTSYKSAADSARKGEVGKHARGASDIAQRIGVDKAVVIAIAAELGLIL